MQEKVKTNPFLGLLLLDLVGTVLVGIGLAKTISGVEVLPDWLRFKNYDVIFIVLGILLTLPYLLHIFAKAREKSEKNLFK